MKLSKEKKEKLQEKLLQEMRVSHFLEKKREIQAVKKKLEQLEKDFECFHDMCIGGR